MEEKIIQIVITKFKTEHDNFGFKISEMSATRTVDNIYCSTLHYGNALKASLSKLELHETYNPPR